MQTIMIVEDEKVIRDAIVQELENGIMKSLRWKTFRKSTLNF